MKMKMILITPTPVVAFLFAVSVITTITTSGGVDAVPVLKQLHVISRHGARTPLPKEPDTLLEEAGSSLTPLGQQQLYNLGDWVRTNYNHDIDEGASIGGGGGGGGSSTGSGSGQTKFLQYYDGRYHRMESSNLDRTITSANSFTRGLFQINGQIMETYDGNSQFVQSLLPQMPSVPVYTRQEHNDIVLRSYRTCPKFHDNLSELYTSNSWLNLEANNYQLLLKLSQLFPEKIPQNKTLISLGHLWNVYDPIHVARTECGHDVSGVTCTALQEPGLVDALTDDEFNELEDLMEQTERMKFGVSTAGNLLGSNLLWQILFRVTGVGRFFLYSAHAPTVLGFLSTLQEVPVDERFVDYGSAIIVEIFQDDATNENSIRFAYKAASRNEPRYFQLSNVDCGGSAGGEYTCPLAKFIIWAEENTIKPDPDGLYRQWCKACENIQSDECLKVTVEENGLLTGNGADGTKNGLGEDLDELEETLRENGVQPIAIAAAFFMGTLSGILILSICCLCFCKNGQPTATTMSTTTITTTNTNEPMSQKRQHHHHYRHDAVDEEYIGGSQPILVDDDDDDDNININNNNNSNDVVDGGRNGNYTIGDMNDNDENNEMMNGLTVKEENKIT